MGELLREGNRLIEEGDLEAASEPLLRATGLAERDRGVLAALARLETLRADATWLRLRLLDPQVTELVQATHRELGRRVGKARTAADAAFAVGPGTSSCCARASNVAPQRRGRQSREWIKPIASNPSDPQNLRLARSIGGRESLLVDVIDRRAHRGRRRARSRSAHAALVYALARGGRLTEAETEVASSTPARAPRCSS